jgi:hypothetical protein
VRRAVPTIETGLVASSANQTGAFIVSRAWKVEESGKMDLEAVLSIWGGGVNEMEEFIEVARAAWMAVRIREGAESRYVFSVYDARWDSGRFGSRCRA